MQILKSSKWLLKLLHIITWFLIYHGVFFVYNGDTENTEIFSSWYHFCYFLVCNQDSEEHKLLLLRVLCVSCCFLLQ